ncbi:MAG: tRNA uridine-5-carboxymethylaminomethyl(34) synthesis GTPase MnmE [Oscillospiraceae bacterium]|nr:tRNA uridine-5-carboxymethylaminomethyl(34) synthesis GTPase MnmE [Oscillospiraceae bacterium]
MSTIAAISTPLSASGLGVIRISGEEAVSIGEKMFRPFKGGKELHTLAGYSCAYGRVFDAEGDIDEAVATVFLAPKSYTGENTVEFSCHGSPALLKRVLRAALDAGAGLAGPGEFTKRALLNGKMTLTQAEAVMDMISAKSASAGKAALVVRDGALYKKIRSVTEKLTELETHLAAWSDYPEEDVEELSEEHLEAVLKESDAVLKRLMETYDIGKVIREGATTVIAGKPNVGKSTLMNLLSGRDRSIVTEIAGTTRDVVEESVLVGDIPIRLLDTAGLRDTEDAVEKIGVDMANTEIERCDVVIAVFDSSRPFDDTDFELIEKLKSRPAVAVINKSDLETLADIEAVKNGFEHVVVISAANGDGEEEFRRALSMVLKTADLDPAEPVMANERQLDCVRRGKKAIGEALDAVAFGMTLDAVGICIETALDALYELTGEKASDAVIEKVFERFCVGK